MSTAAFAGGVERNAFSPNFLFEKGDYVELSFGHAAPDVSGTQAVNVPIPGVGVLPAGGNSGDMAGNYTTVTLSYKQQVNDKFALGVVLDQPIGAKVDYGSPVYLYGTGAGSQAEISSTGLTVLAHYRISDRVSVYGGVKGQQASGTVALFNGYSMSTTKETDFGVVVGAAYEIPDIALRVALTYTSDITHDFTVRENNNPSLPFSTTVPQSVALDFQSGVAQDTLVFGSIRWRDWSEFDITPVGFAAATNGSSLVSYDNDSITYTLGVGRRFSEQWSGALFAAHEPAGGGFSGNLGPTDGYTSVGLGATYTSGQIKVTGGVTYAWIGDAVTQAPAPFPAGTTFGRFNDNRLLGVGLRVGYSF
jgi:long-subunit fatty acid transport protein